MQDFATGWFDTLQNNIQANCKARVNRNFKEIRIDWTVLMKLKNSSDSLSKDTYIDAVVKGNSIDISGTIKGITEEIVDENIETSEEETVKEPYEEDPEEIENESTDVSDETIIEYTPIDYGEQTDRVKNTGESWNGTSEHGISGTFTFEDVNAGYGELKFDAVSNLALADVFKDIVLTINYDKYDESAVADTNMPFHSVFTTEEYLENHKNLIPRHFICNN